ncbi:hypothetical protein ACHAWF_008040 [Thalassiosira exigua]
MRRARRLACLSTLVVAGGAAFSAVPSSRATQRSTLTPPSATRDADDAGDAQRTAGAGGRGRDVGLARSVAGAALSLAVLAFPLQSATIGVARADEYGRETEAPTLFTGETVMICKKRGPLGACLETSVRTVENDNDKALKYFKDPSAKVKERQEMMRRSADEDVEGNALVQKLRAQSEENREKNDLAVRQKTLLNDQGASFGPFDRQVVILNTDGKTFTLLQNPQAMRLKKAGYIEDRKFVIQPSQEVIDDALVGENFGDAIKGLFGGKENEGSNEGEAKEVESGDVASAEDILAVEDSDLVEGENVKNFAEEVVGST